MSTSHYPEGESPLTEATDSLEETPATRQLSRPKGPSWSTVALGLICMVVAGGVLFVELTDTAIDWASTGPLALVGTGLLLVLVGLAALASRSDDDED